MQLGIPWWIGAGSPEEGIELAHSLDLDLVEVSLDAPWPEGLSGPAIREASEETGIAVGFHGPWRTQSLAHPRGVLARAAQTVAQECIDLAVGAGAEYVVFHVDARDFSRFPAEEAVHEGLEQAHASLRALSRSAGEDLDILVENTSSPMGTPKELRSFLDPLPEVGFCYDPGHAAMVVDAEVEGGSEDPAVWADALGDRYELLHLMDMVRTDRGLVDHLVPGAGEADLGAIVDAALGVGCERVLMEAFFRNVQREEARTRDLAEARDLVRSLL